MVSIGCIWVIRYGRFEIKNCVHRITNRIHFINCTKSATWLMTIESWGWQNQWMLWKTRSNPKCKLIFHKIAMLQRVIGQFNENWIHSIPFQWYSYGRQKTNLKNYSKWLTTPSTRICIVNSRFFSLNLFFSESLTVASK